MNILVVDDEPAQRDLLAGYLKKQGHSVKTAGNGDEAIRLNSEDTFDLAILDLKMPGLDGVETMARMKKIDPTTYFIILTGYGTVESAVRAMKLGAYDYLNKPINLDELEIIINRIGEEKGLHQELDLLRSELNEFFPVESFVAESDEMKEILKIVNRVAKSNATVLLLGESGTGKEMIARLIHRLSPRRERRFIPISCAALPETLLESELFGYERGAFTGAEKRHYGKFELAHQGTLFLDEIGDLPLSIQVKLLRVLQDFTFERLGSNRPIKVDVRLISATNQNLQRKIAQGKFREDLYYRLNVISIEIPPLRERRGDIQPLAEYFLKKFCQRSHKEIKGITPEALKRLVRYDWPGNIRELENVMERAVVLCTGGYITEKEIPLEWHTEQESGSLAQMEKSHIERVLRKTGWNLSESARILGIHRNTLRAKIKEYKIKKKV